MMIEKYMMIFLMTMMKKIAAAAAAAAAADDDDDDDTKAVEASNQERIGINPTSILTPIIIGVDYTMITHDIDKDDHYDRQYSSSLSSFHCNGVSLLGMLLCPTMIHVDIP